MSPRRPMTPTGNRNRRAIRCNDASIAKVMLSFNCRGNCTGLDCCLALAGEPLALGAGLARGGAAASVPREDPWSTPVGAVVMLIEAASSAAHSNGQSNPAAQPQARAIAARD